MIVRNCEKKNKSKPDLIWGHGSNIVGPKVKITTCRVGMGRDEDKKLSPSNGSQKINIGKNKTKINILFETITAFKRVKHRIQSGFKIIVCSGIGIKIEVQIEMYDISIEPRIEMVISNKTRYVVHPLNMDRDYCHRLGEDFGPVLSGRGNGTKRVLLHQA